MAVHEDRRFALGMEPVGVDHRMAFRFIDAGILKAGFRQRLNKPFCAFLHIGFMLGKGADRWNAQKVFQFFEVCLAVIFEVLIDLSGVHEIPAFQYF